MTSPRGITAARPPFFILPVVARPLGFFDIGDLKRLRCLLEPCLEFFHFSENNCRTRCFGKTVWAYALSFFIFPKTAAEPGASEKPCAHLGRLLGGLGRVLSPLDRLLEASWGLLGRSWRLPGASWAPLGPSWAVLEAIQNNTNIRWKTRTILAPESPHTISTLGGGLGSQNRPKSHPKRIKI